MQFTVSLSRIRHYDAFFVVEAMDAEEAANKALEIGRNESEVSAWTDSWEDPTVDYVAPGDVTHA